MHQVADQEPRPGIARARVRSQEDVIGENRNVALNAKPSEQHIVHPRQMLQSPLDHAVISPYSSLFASLTRELLRRAGCALPLTSREISVCARTCSALHCAAHPRSDTATS